MLPKLHYALDTLSIEETLSCLKDGIGEEAEVIELGSSILFAEGNRVIKYVKTLFPDKEIVADIKMLMPTARGSIPPLMDSGADAVIAVSCEDMGMIQTAVDEIYKKRNKKMYMYLHVENQRNFQDAQLDAWRTAGIQNVIYHSINPGFAWNDRDTETVERFCRKGFQVSVTGKLKRERIQDFQGLPIYSFIVGTAIAKSENPLAEIRALKKEIQRVFNC